MNVPCKRKRACKLKKVQTRRKKNYEDIILLLFLIDLMLYCYFLHSVF